ncbi:MAG: toxin-antitoxin system YwqK family antitoxin [Bacteroidota bacterium]
MNKLHLILLLVLSGLMINCGNRNKEVVITHPNGEPQKVEHFHYEGNSRKVDKVVYFYKDGVKESEIKMKDGKKHGEVKYYYNNGQIKLRENYKAGQLHGKCTEYYVDGTVNYEAHYKNGIPHGKWVYYDENGNIKSKQKFKDGKLIEEN